MHIAYCKSHLGLVYPNYQLTLREYLRNYRYHKQLNQIFLQIANGISELRQGNYVHRDLKPENIVLNLEPLQVRIIDFDIANLKTEDRIGTVKGTPGYYPHREDIRDGSTYSIWAFVAIMAESDMEKDAYYRVETDKQIKTAL